MDIFIQHPQTNHAHVPGGALPVEGGAPASAISSAGGARLPGWGTLASE